MRGFNINLDPGGDVGANQLADTGADPKIRCGSAGKCRAIMHSNRAKRVK
jgi:hypothetical protein